MEEFVGELWHKLVSRGARRDFPDCVITLEEMRKAAGILFRASGGDPGLRIEAGTPTWHGGRRSLMQRLAGSGHRIELAWRDDEAVHLPVRIACYPDALLNRELYLWLSMLVAQGAAGESDWFGDNQARCVRLLAHYPGLADRYQRLVTAELARRPDPDRLPADEAAQERAIRDALRVPGSVAQLPTGRKPPAPVQLWLHPNPPYQVGANEAVAEPAGDGAPSAAPGQSRKDTRRRRAERVAMPDTRAGIMLHRFEGFLGWTEFVPVNRGGEEEDDDDAARRAADDLDVMSVARDATAGSSRVRFDLDLPSSASDDLALGPGIALPEWDFSSARLQAGYCRLQPMIAADAPPVDLPPPLRITARRLRRQFEALRPARQWVRNAPDGSDVDLDAYIQYAAERQQGERAGDMRWYRDFRNGERSLACLLLADLSLSTDTWIGNHARVIDVIRDSLFLFAEALSAVGDELGIFGFSSRRRDHVRFNVLKDFSETYNREVRGRIAAIKPGYYTRMGAAIRYASRLLAQRSAQQRLLLIVTDGKPNDLDRYEGRYGIEDTRHAVQDARKQGLEPFCVTVDAEAGDYLPHLFGNDGYVLVRTPSELPARLPAVYARLTR